MPDQVNDQIKKIEDTAKKLAWDAVVKTVLIYFHIDFFPISLVVGLITDKVWEGLRTQADNFAISFLDHEAQRTNTDAQVQLLLIGQKTGFDSPEFKKAKEEATHALVAHLQYASTRKSA